MLSAWCLTCCHSDARSLPCLSVWCSVARFTDTLTRAIATLLLVLLVGKTLLAIGTDRVSTGVVLNGEVANHSAEQ